MQAAEAIQCLIHDSDQLRAQTERTEQNDDWFHRSELSVAVAQAMLNSMIPVARFRAFVEVDPIQPKRTAHQDKTAICYEFTICGINIEAIRGGLLGLLNAPTNCRVLVFEQRATGADVVSGFQGETKTQKYRNFLHELSALEAPSVAVN